MTEELDDRALAEVTCDTGAERPTLMFRRILRHSPKAVWRALTDAEQLRHWAPFVPDRNLVTAGPATLTMTDGSPDGDVPSVVVTAVEPTLLEYNWGGDRIVWELEPVDGGTRLTLHHTVDDEDWVPKVAAGWHLCLAVVERLLDGHRVNRIVGTEAKAHGWERLHDAYAKALGIVGTGWPDDMSRGG